VIYQKPIDLTRETQLVREFVARLVRRCEMRKIGGYSELDFALVEPGDEGIYAFVEAKNRDYASTTFQTLMLSLHKWQALKRDGPHAEVGGILLVRWSDGVVGFLHERDWPRALPARWGGRSDRGNPNDKEPVVDLPIAAFELL